MAPDFQLCGGLQQVLHSDLWHFVNFGYEYDCRYLFMHETCWALSADVAHLSKQLEL